MSPVTSSVGVLVVVVMLVVCQCYCSAQCTPSPPNGLIIPPIITGPATFNTSRPRFSLIVLLFVIFVMVIN